MITGKIVVTGGGGFIGKALVQALLREGAQVTVIGRNAYPQLDALGVPCIRGDIRDQDFLLQAFAGYSTVFHVAAKAGIWGPQNEYFAINTLGSRNVINACLHNAVSNLIYTSTPSVVFDREDIAGGDESLPYARQPLCYYAASKIAAEKSVLGANSSQLRTVAIRPHLVWGPGDRHLIPRLLESGRAGLLKIVGSGYNLVDIAYIDNVVNAHLLAAENLQRTATAAGQAFFIGQKEPVNLWEWINALFVQVGIQPVRKSVPFPLAYILGGCLEMAATLTRRKEEPRMTRFLAHQLAHSHWFSHRRAEKVLGYEEKISSKVGMERLLAWLQQE
ncbi:MAG: NAD-dependent epimerase/dehydratase family protein [Desulfobulbus sp.]|nr:NAD-dependent epimerase/dehydratase family protein [Desulfobulbus sp.]